MQDQLKEALLTLDPDDDAHWTEDGLPVVQIVADMVGDENLTREAISEAAPQFGRDGLRKLREAAELSGDEEELPEEVDAETALAAKLRDIDERLNELYAARQDLDAKISQVQRQRSQVASASAKTRNEGSTQQAIRAAIDSSNKQRAARVATHNAIMQKIGPDQVDPRSPYERARQQQRPQSR